MKVNSIDSSQKRVEPWSRKSSMNMLLTLEGFGLAVVRHVGGTVTVETMAVLGSRDVDHLLAPMAGKAHTASINLTVDKTSIVGMDKDTVSMMMTVQEQKFVSREIANTALKVRKTVTGIIKGQRASIVENKNAKGAQKAHLVKKILTVMRAAYVQGKNAAQAWKAPAVGSTVIVMNPWAWIA